MPRVKSKPTPVVKPVPPAPPTPPPAAPAATAAAALAPNKPARSVIYDRLIIQEYSTTSPKGPVDIEWCKAALGWETEKEYQVRMVAEENAKGNTSAKPEHFLFGDGVLKPDGTTQPVHCRNTAGEKVVCWNNAGNRPFNEGWCEELIDMLLTGQWAGPHTIPGETVNGETIRISRYGDVLSGQHQMTACILGGEKLEKARRDGVDTPANPKYPTWKSFGAGQAPFIETVVVKGMSDDPRVLMTVDYNKPRSVADVFYTSEVFRQAKPVDRKELCRMLAAACNTLWTRTDARGYRTHPEMVAFLERHKRLLKCVQHLFAENNSQSTRRIALLRLNVGQCAAIMYLQAASGPKTDGDFYRNEEPPSEKNLDFSYWDKAEEFWTLLANGRDFMNVRTALAQLVDSSPGSDDNQGLGGLGPEKLAILARAWERWKDHPANGGPPFDAADLQDGGQLSLSYSDLDDRGNKLPDGAIKLVDVADFLGIDCPASAGKGRTATTAPPDPPAPSPEEIKRLTEEALARRKAGPKK